MANQHSFTGVFIPAHIWLSKELAPAEKMILGEIDALSKKTGWCTAGRKHFAEWLQCTKPNVSYFFIKLERLGFIEIKRTPGYGSKIRIIDAKFYISEVVNGVDQGGKEGLPVGVNGINQGGKEGLPVNIIDIQSLNLNKMGERTAENPPSNPYPKVEDIIHETFGLNAENEKTDNQPGGEILAKVIDPNLPGVVMFDKVDPPAPKTAPEKTGRTRQTRIDLPEIPERLNSPKFCEAWKTLCGMPKWRRKPVEALEMSLKKLAAFDVEFATAQVESAISGNWQGLIFADTAAKYSDWQRNRSNQQQTKQAGSRNGTTINSWDGDPKRYTEKQIF